jgi:hypothetical protein
MRDDLHLQLPESWQNIRVSFILWLPGCSQKKWGPLKLRLPGTGHHVNEAGILARNVIAHRRFYSTVKLFKQHQLNDVTTDKGWEYQLNKRIACITREKNTSLCACSQDFSPPLSLAVYSPPVQTMAWSMVDSRRHVGVASWASRCPLPGGIGLRSGPWGVGCCCRFLLWEWCGAFLPNGSDCLCRICTVAYTTL